MGVPKHLDKSGFHQRIQLVQLLAAFGNQVTDFVQHRRDFALFVKGREGDFNIFDNAL